MMKRRVFFVCVIVLVALLGAGCASTSESPENRDTSSTPREEEPKDPGTEEGVGAPEQDAPVQFECPELERIVKEALSITSEVVTVNEMLEFYDLNLDGESVESLVGLEHAKNLYAVSIKKNAVDMGGLEALDQLPILSSVFIAYTDFSSPIEWTRLDALERLTILSSNVSDVDFVGHLTALTHLNLSQNPLGPLDVLSNLTALEHLDLNDSDITTVEPLGGLSNIRVLNIQKNRVDDIGPLAGMTSLEIAILSYNPITNLKPLEHLPNLKEVTIYLDHDVKHHIFDHVNMLLEKGIRVDYTR